MISYEPPRQEIVHVGDYMPGIGTVLDPDDEEMLEFMKMVNEKTDRHDGSQCMKDDTDYVTGSTEPHAHLNACGTGELTVFLDPSKVKTLTLMGDEVRHYDLLEKPTSNQRCAFCGGTIEEVAYLVESPMGPCICDSCAIQTIHLMLGKAAEK